MAAFWAAAHASPETAATAAKTSLCYDMRAREKALPVESRMEVIASGSDDQIVAFIQDRKPVWEETVADEAIEELRGEPRGQVEDLPAAATAVVPVVPTGSSNDGGQAENLSAAGNDGQVEDLPAAGNDGGQAEDLPAAAMVVVPVVPAAGGNGGGQVADLPPTAVVPVSGEQVEPLPETGSIYDGVRGQRSMRGGKARHATRGTSQKYLGGEAKPLKQARAPARARVRPCKCKQVAAHVPPDASRRVHHQVDTMRPITGVRGAAAVGGVARLTVNASKKGHGGGRVTQTLAAALKKMTASSTGHRPPQHKPPGAADLSKRKRGGDRATRRARTAYVEFCTASRAAVQAQNPTANCACPLPNGLPSKSSLVSCMHAR